MTPLDFIKDAADNDFNTAAGYIVEALSKPIQIHGAREKFEILSYYYDEKKKCMILDVEPK